MGFRLAGKDGEDPTKEVILRMEENKKTLARDIIMYWFAESQEWLAEAATNRSEIDSEGRKGRKSNGLDKLQQMAQPPSWNASEGYWSFSYPHAGAVFQEFGARAHEITAKRAEYLAFEWPDAPKEVQEQFEHTEGDLVFFKSIDHPGIPAIGFVRRGRDKTELKLRERGIKTKEFQG